MVDAIFNISSVSVCCVFLFFWGWNDTVDLYFHTLAAPVPIEFSSHQSDALL